MPLYAYHCAHCDTARDAFRRIADRDDGPVCCGEVMRRQITACMVFVPQNLAYQCPVTDQVVTSERQRRNIMAEHRLIDANDFPPQKVFAAAKKKRADNEALAAKLTEGIAPEIIAQASAMLDP